MRQEFLCAVVSAAIFAGGLAAGPNVTASGAGPAALVAGIPLAAENEATVVRYDKDTMKLVVKEGEKERTIQLQRNTHVHYAEGGRVKEVSAKDRPEYLKKGTKVVIEEEGGKVIEINIKK